MSFGQVPVRSLSITLCVVLLAALFPAAVVAAQDGKHREYIVTLSVKDSGRSIKPTNRTNKQRIRQRSKAARETTNQVSQRHGVKARYRYTNAVTGFSARMTRAEAAQVARDPSVANVRPARRFKVSGEILPHGVKRVKAAVGSFSGIGNVNVGVIDTGIGPANGDGVPIIGSNELNIAGGVNCYDDPSTPENEAYEANNPEVYDGWWGDTQGHGTHVAGIIGARDNTVSTIGVAPGVKLWSLRVFKGRSGSEAAVVCALDWAIGTHSNASPDVDVLNMSIEGGRIDTQENCANILVDPSADPMQKSICTATNMGIVVVAAAGNDGIDANNSAPGGFDQVITVGAMTDTDGVGWEQGPNAGCFGYTGERDDTMASYSNWGPDVDIVAPGTCVASTSYNNPDGNPVFMTGTSMAAPHVTGAVARYIAAQGAPLPLQSRQSTMRQLIRAAGTMNWDARTDPIWDGVNDSDAPNRVLDVEDLIGGHTLKAFVYHDSFKVGGSDMSRATRVDIQRGGGYDGTVNLSLQGLPGAAGSASFDPNSLNGLGRNKLGATLDFNLNGAGGEGEHSLDITANGTGVSAHSRSLNLTIDRTGPTVTGLAPKIRGDKVSTTAKGTAQVFLQWTASDALSGLKSAQLQRKTGSAAWKNAGVAGVSSARVSLKPGQGNLFRVKATDEVGNTKTSGAIGARLSVRDDKSPKWNKTGTWKTKKVKKAFGGSILLASGSGKRLTTGFNGKAVAIVASLGPGRGKFRVRVDGGSWHTVNTKESSASHRRVVWTTRLASGNHNVEIQSLSGQTAVDALLIVR